MLSSSAPDRESSLFHHHHQNDWSHVKSKRERKQERQATKNSTIDFEFDEDLSTRGVRGYEDDLENDDTIDDNDINKLYIITQPTRTLTTSLNPASSSSSSSAKHDRTADYNSRSKITHDLAKQINDGLYYYEQDILVDHDNDDDDDDDDEELKPMRRVKVSYNELKTVNMISQEEFDRLKIIEDLKRGIPPAITQESILNKKIEFSIDLNKLKISKLRPMKSTKTTPIPQASSSTSSATDEIVHSLPVLAPINLFKKVQFSNQQSSQSNNRFYPVIKDTHTNKLQAGKISRSIKKTFCFNL